MARSVKEAGKKPMGLVPSPGHGVPLRGHVVPRRGLLGILILGEMAPQQDRLNWLTRQKTTRLKAHQGLKERVFVHIPFSEN